MSEHVAGELLAPAQPADLARIRALLVATARGSAPPAIRATREFSDLCPSTSACMAKRVGG
jgi:hypothetical protein